jgi:hypothetical protein
MQDQRRETAGKEAAGRRATDAQVLEDGLKNGTLSLRSVTDCGI